LAFFLAAPLTAVDAPAAVAAPGACLVPGGPGLFLLLLLLRLTLLPLPAPDLRLVLAACTLSVAFASCAAVPAGYNSMCLQHAAAQCIFQAA
jgi:hypothetical protein